MEHFKRLPDSELEIMMIVWQAGKAVDATYIQEKLPASKNWAYTTVLNFLARLVERGFLETSKQGRINYYSPLIKEAAYVQKESRSFLQRMRFGSPKSFVAALYDGDAIKPDELEELKEYIEKISARVKE